MTMAEIGFVAVSVQQDTVGERLLLLNIKLGKTVFKERVQGENFLGENTACCE